VPIFKSMLQRNVILLSSSTVKIDEKGNYYHDEWEVIWAKNGQHILLGVVKNVNRWWLKPVSMSLDAKFKEIIKLLPKEYYED